MHCVPDIPLPTQTSNWEQHWLNVMRAIWFWSWYIEEISDCEDREWDCIERNRLVCGVLCCQNHFLSHTKLPKKLNVSSSIIMCGLPAFLNLKSFLVCTQNMLGLMKYATSVVFQPCWRNPDQHRETQYKIPQNIIVFIILIPSGVNVTFYDAHTHKSWTRAKGGLCIANRLNNNPKTQSVQCS